MLKGSSNDGGQTAWDDLGLQAFSRHLAGIKRAQAGAGEPLTLGRA